MIEIKGPQEIARLRRLALAAQGLLRTQSWGRGLPGARKVINHLGYVQIDTISVVERAHHHVLYTRVPGYKPAMIRQMLLDRDIFEYWAHAAAFLPGALECSQPRLQNRLLMLSPFDNSVIQRERLKALFEFHFQLECYLPAARRRYGYFCLPLLYRDKFIGRMDGKAHRKDCHLEIKSLVFEQHAFDEESVITAFSDAITNFCQFQNCNSVSLTTVQPKHLTQRLRSILKATA